MNILYYECFAGLSGDMNLAAMFSLGVDPDVVRKELSKLGLDDEFSIHVREDARNGISGTRVDVELRHDPHSSDNHVHRTLGDIEEIVHKSTLQKEIKETALAIFTELAQAEAAVHGKALYEVHFHEVGAIDSIVDIVGAAICYHLLNVDEVWCSSIELGGGFVKCAHGLIPVPAPATVEVLRGCPTTRGAVKKEMTTPTGGAIVRTLVDSFTDSPALSVQRTGYGIGHRQVDIPNVVRVSLALVSEQKDNKQPPKDINEYSACLLECNLDDMTPEVLGGVLDELMEAGAMDVHFTPIVMKKNRPAITLSLLCSMKDKEYFRRLLFTHTTTLGIKCFTVEKSELVRTFEQVETPLGLVTFKHAMLNGEVLRSKPELDDCRKLAKQHGLPLGEVYARISGSVK